MRANVFLYFHLDVERKIIEIKNVLTRYITILKNYSLLAIVFWDMLAPFHSITKSKTRKTRQDSKTRQDLSFAAATIAVW